MRTVFVMLLFLLSIPAVYAQDVYTVAPGDSLMHISRQFNVCVEAILEANPDLHPRSIFNIQTNDTISIPANAAPCYMLGTDTFEYTVEEFDSLYGLAYFYGVPVMSIVEASGTITNPNLIEIGQILSVPISTDERIDYTFFPFNVTGIYGTYHDTESLAAFSRRMGFEVHHVARWNDLPIVVDIRRGQPLHVVTEARFRVQTDTVPANYRRIHLTNWGDTFLGLALRYDTSYEKLIEINNVSNPHSLGQRQLVFIPDATGEAPQPIDTTADHYTARWGDTLHSISRQFGTLPQLIALVNNVPNPDQIDIGDTLAIPAYIRVSSGIMQAAALLVLVPLTVLVTSRLTGKRKRKPKPKHS